MLHLFVSLLAAMFHENLNRVLRIFIDNGKDGREQTLQSNAKKCSMVFAVEHTSGADKAIHDMSYGKCFNPDGRVEKLLKVKKG